MVAGGIGQTPFLALALEALGKRVYGCPPRDVTRSDQVTLCYGVRTRAMMACVDDFRRAGVHVRVSSDDGSVGHAGLVTDLLHEIVAESPRACRVVCCGPVPMMRSAAAMTAAADVPCQVSLETPMACGIGICFSCVIKVRLADGSWDYKRTCVEGPVFDADRIVW
jgi:dihydroorotate dehydrogenase electron transfer subunit